MLVLRDIEPHDVILVTGPATIHLHPEKGRHVAAVTADPETIVAHVRAKEFGDLEKRHGGDPLKMAQEIRDRDDQA